MNAEDHIRASDERIRRAAVVVVVMRGDETLVIRRGASVVHPGYFAPLSGKVDPDEDERAAVIRETREEVGLEVTPIRRVWQCLSDDGNYDLSWWLAASPDGEPVLNQDEVSEVRWILPSEFHKLPDTFADDRKFYAEVLPLLPELRGGE